jgi:3-hydroxy-3-methylglutaryl CoA synthase
MIIDNAKWQKDLSKAIDADWKAMDEERQEEIISEYKRLFKEPKKCKKNDKKDDKKDAGMSYTKDDMWV